ncbi:hypothetical protein EVAR_52116_1 [Eumeta japonica]|uniref:Uncharacterized protein n=1 Tax=Eumeta variegata TaxID=151549 RepID=A0A4C1XQT7_EUMVA|nr:hypothetical protein EVAR_52116_1 [Eumeta japonica]
MVILHLAPAHAEPQVSATFPTSVSVVGFCADQRLYGVAVLVGLEMHVNPSVFVIASATAAVSRSVHRTKLCRREVGHENVAEEKGRGASHARALYHSQAIHSGGVWCVVLYPRTRSLIRKYLHYQTNINVNVARIENA